MVSYEVYESSTEEEWICPQTLNSSHMCEWQIVGFCSFFSSDNILALQVEPLFHIANFIQETIDVMVLTYNGCIIRDFISGHHHKLFIDCSQTFFHRWLWQKQLLGIIFFRSLSICPMTRSRIELIHPKKAFIRFTLMFCPFYSIFFDSIHNGFEIIVLVDVSLSPVFRTILE